MTCLNLTLPDELEFVFQVQGSSINSSLKSPMVPAVKVMATSECLVSVLSTASEKWSLVFSLPLRLQFVSLPWNLGLAM